MPNKSRDHSGACWYYEQLFRLPDKSGTYFIDAETELDIWLGWDSVNSNALAQSARPP